MLTSAVHPLSGAHLHLHPLSCVCVCVCTLLPCLQAAPSAQPSPSPSSTQEGSAASMQHYEFSLAEERLLRGLTEAVSTAGLALGLQAFVTLMLSKCSRGVTSSPVRGVCKVKWVASPASPVTGVRRPTTDRGA